MAENMFFGGGPTGGSTRGTGGGSLPRYREPAYDMGKISYLGQQQMAPQRNLARRGLQKATSGYFDNPAERDAATAAALEGYGAALGPIQAGGMQAGREMYEQEFEGLQRQADADYERQMMAWKLKQIEKEKQAQLGTGPQTYGQYGLITPSSAPSTTMSSTETRRLPPQYIETGYRSLPRDTSPASWERDYGNTPTVYGAGSEAGSRQAMDEASMLKIQSSSGWSY